MFAFAATARACRSTSNLDSYLEQISENLWPRDFSAWYTLPEISVVNEFPISNKIFLTFILTSVFVVCSCAGEQLPQTKIPAEPSARSEKTQKIKNTSRVIHVLVALCDNENQGIVPVPAHLGNGDDPPRNLYWGARNGVKTFFAKSKNWQKVIELQNPKPNVLERLIFKHRNADVYLIADAYRGIKMRETIDDFFGAASGKQIENIDIEDKRFQILGSSSLIVFVGHNGLMDFELESEPKKQDNDKRETIVLACASWNYFSRHLKPTGAEPLLWTSNLMAPEAYTLHDAIEGWIKNESPQAIRKRAASAYAKYQGISQKSAENLFVAGW